MIIDASNVNRLTELICNCMYLQTYIGDILVAINPFKYLSIYEKEVRMCFLGLYR